MKTNMPFLWLLCFIFLMPFGCGDPEENPDVECPQTVCVGVGEQVQNNITITCAIDANRCLYVSNVSPCTTPTCQGMQDMGSSSMDMSVAVDQDTTKPDASSDDMSGDIDMAQGEDMKVDMATDMADVDMNPFLLDPDSTRPLRLLFIGNSFLQQGPVSDLVRDIASSAGWPTPVVKLAAVGGKDLAFHLTHQDTLDAVDEGNWDAVIVQEFSLRPTVNAGDPLAFKKDATSLFDLIKQKSPASRVILFETWARHPDHSIYTNTFQDAAQFQEQLRFHYNDAATNYIPNNATSPTSSRDPEVAPVGTTWESHLRRTEPQRLHQGDNYHANANGRYLSALVVYSMIYNRSPVGVGKLNLTEDQAKVLQEDVADTTGKTIVGDPDGNPIVPKDFPDLAVGETIQLDVGASMTTTPEPWNNINGLTGIVLSALNTSGSATKVSFSTPAPFDGVNEVGNPMNSLGYPASAVSDSGFIGSFTDHATALGKVATLRIENLDPSGYYDMKLYSSRTGNDSGNGRLTRYTVGSSFQDFDVSDNMSTTVDFVSVAPDAQGVIELNVEVSPDGTSRFAYLGLVELTRTDVTPQAPDLALGEVVQVDFGGGMRTTPSPWNNLDGRSGVLMEALNSLGVATRVSISTPDAFTGSNSAGVMTNTLGYPETAGSDSAFIGSFTSHADALGQVAKVRIENLIAGEEYNLKLYSSRIGNDSGNGRLTRYTVGSDFKDFDSSDNTDTTVDFSGVVADAQGVIELSVEVSPDGQGKFAYLGLMELSRGQVVPVVPDLAVGEAIQMDFGAGSRTTPSPWNNLNGTTDVVNTALNTLSVATRVSISTPDAFDGPNTGGAMTNTLGYPTTAGSDSAYIGSFTDHATALGKVGKVRIENLDPSGHYDLTLYSSRTGNDGGNGRLTRYTVGSDFKDFDPSDNMDTTVDFVSVAPDAQGVIELSVEVSPDGMSRFAYLGLVELTRTDMPPQAADLAVGETIQVDFGSGSRTTPSPWNNLNGTTDVASMALNSMGVATRVSISTPEAFGGPNTGGVMTNTLGYPETAGSDSAYIGSFMNHADALGKVAKVRLENLVPGGMYSLKLYSSRTGNDSGNGRLTRYTAGGGFQDFDPADNTSTTVDFISVSPDAQGVIELSVEVSPAGMSRFAYLGLMEITRDM